MAVVCMIVIGTSSSLYHLVHKCCIKQQPVKPTPHMYEQGDDDAYIQYNYLFRSLNNLRRTETAHRTSHF